jgi:hypothetical protein
MMTAVPVTARKGTAALQCADSPSATVPAIPVRKSNPAVTSQATEKTNTDGWVPTVPASSDPPCGRSAIVPENSGRHELRPAEPLAHALILTSKTEAWPFKIHRAHPPRAVQYSPDSASETVSFPIASRAVSGETTLKGSLTRTPGALPRTASRSSNPGRAKPELTRASSTRAYRAAAETPHLLTGDRYLDERLAR